jgi:hypothetical protein
MKDSPGKSEPTVFHRVGDPGNHGVPLPEPVRLEDGRAIFGAAAGKLTLEKIPGLERRTDGPYDFHLGMSLMWLALLVTGMACLLFKLL